MASGSAPEGLDLSCYAFTSLPNETLSHIISYLRPHEVMSLWQTCKACNECDWWFTSSSSGGGGVLGCVYNHPERDMKCPFPPISHDPRWYTWWHIRKALPTAEEMYRPQNVKLHDERCLVHIIRTDYTFGSSLADGFKLTKKDVNIVGVFDQRVLFDFRFDDFKNNKPEYLIERRSESHAGILLYNPAYEQPVEAVLAAIKLFAKNPPRRGPVAVFADLCNEKDKYQRIYGISFNKPNIEGAGPAIRVNREGHDRDPADQDDDDDGSAYVCNLQAALFMNKIKGLPFSDELLETIKANVLRVERAAAKVGMRHATVHSRSGSGVDFAMRVLLTATFRPDKTAITAPPSEPKCIIS
eukprot:TRINITY_DN16577_c0_g1_i1.p1 TRINITY_DN16577_c0_g1~~TRINITY_DN16577_c0_g1_i1.p1  ORF type:complete len:356 (-),score=40.10 TRINITY_DN16577_c0_g1_i1:681-1748(-)